MSDPSTVVAARLVNPAGESVPVDFTINPTVNGFPIGGGGDGSGGAVGVAAINGGTIDNVIIRGSQVQNTIIGAVSPAAGTFSTLTGNNVTLNGGTLNNVNIGVSTPGTGTFSVLTATDLAVTGNCNLAGFSYSGNVNTNSPGFFDLPSGTTSQRPVVASSGMVRFNTSLVQFEGYNGSAWASLGTTSGGGGTGTPGADGRGIVSILRTSGNGAAGTTDTYTITYTNNTTSTFNVVNGSVGSAGLPGANGRGIVNTIRTSGNGAPGTVDTYSIFYTDNTTSTFTVSNGSNGTNGATGPAGRGITSVLRTSGNGAPGTVDTYTVRLTDNSTSTFTITNGSVGVAADPQYDISVYIQGLVPASAANLIRIAPARNLNIRPNFSGSRAVARVAATAIKVLNVFKNTTQIGTITFGVGSTSGVFAFQSSPSTPIGLTNVDVLSVGSPGAQDTTLADLSLTIVTDRV